MEQELVERYVNFRDRDLSFLMHDSSVVCQDKQFWLIKNCDLYCLHYQQSNVTRLFSCHTKLTIYSEILTQRQCTGHGQRERERERDTKTHKYTYRQTDGRTDGLSRCRLRRYGKHIVCLSSRRWHWHALIIQKHTCATVFNHVLISLYRWWYFTAALCCLINFSDFYSFHCVLTLPFICQ